MVKIQKTFLIAIFFLFVMTQITYASEERIFDEASLFSETEKQEMNETIQDLIQQLEVDIVVVTTNDNEGKTSLQYAEDFYDENSFGYETSNGGILYLISMDEREVTIFTDGFIHEIISDSHVEEILDEVYVYLGEQQFGESVFAFLDEVERRMSKAMDSYEYDETDIIAEDEVIEEDSFWIEVLIYLAISIVAGGGTVGVMAMYNRGQLTVNSRTYLDKESFKITRKVDRHYNTIVTQQKIERNNSSGGGGISVSSRGGGRGGGTRKF